MLFCSYLVQGDLCSAFQNLVTLSKMFFQQISIHDPHLHICKDKIKHYLPKGGGGSGQKKRKRAGTCETQTWEGEEDMIQFLSEHVIRRHAKENEQCKLDLIHCLYTTEGSQNCIFVSLGRMTDVPLCCVLRERFFFGYKFVSPLFKGTSFLQRY